jgi:hypothetical protein
MGLNGTFIKAKMFDSPLNVRILSSANVPLRPTTAQMPNLVLVETNGVTVYEKKRLNVSSYVLQSDYAE